jgi:hypothetical protein
MEQRRRTFTGPIRNLQGAFDQSSAANTVALRPMSSSASRNVQRVNAYSEGTNVAHGEWAMPGVTHAYATVGRMPEAVRPYSSSTGGTSSFGTSETVRFADQYGLTETYDAPQPMSETNTAIRPMMQRPLLQSWPQVASGVHDYNPRQQVARPSAINTVAPQ